MTNTTPNNVTPMITPSAATIEDAKAWINGMAEKGIYPSSTAKYRVSAIDSLCSVLGHDEPKTAQWVLTHIDEIARRWATVNNANPSTTAQYVSRARGGLEDYLAFLEDPLGHKPRRRDSARQRKEGGPKEKSQTTPTDSPSSPPASVARHTATWRTFPIGTSGEVIAYQLPSGGITMRDAVNFAVHLATLATDFDLADKVMARVFALVRTGEPEH